jgi:hypothetical protein
VEKVISYCKGNKFFIIILAAIIGVAIFAFSLMNINKETINKQVLIDEWEKQLPAGHFLKDESWWAEKELSILQSKLKESFIGTTKITEKVLVKQMGKLEVLYNVYRFFNRSEVEYKLKNESGESIDKVIVNVCDTTEMELWREDEKLSFVLTEEDFRNQPLVSENLVNWIFPQNYVMASIEDTNITTINENFISGKNKGTTALRLYIDNQVLVYSINIK